ncbi:Phage protein, tail component [Lactococcus lactis subsp. lactis KF147]|nr:Phage protein, tail component [Lactococcus lactis subsp. lactis KF147]
MDYSSVKLGNIELMELMIINDVRRGISTAMNNSVYDRYSDGSDVIASRLLSKKIEIDFTILYNIIETKKKLSPIISQKSLQKLIFSDDPNIYWNVIADGEIKVTEHNNGKYTTGTITFLVPSGHAESVTSNILNATNSGGENGTITPNTTDGSIEIKVNNKGTLPTFPKIKLTNVSENGYFGIVGIKGLMGLGNINEADGVTTPKSEQLYDSNTDSSFSKFKDVAAGIVNPQNSLYGTNGTISFQSDGLRFATQGTMSASQIAGGGMKVMTLPADSNGHIGATNLYSHFNLLAWAGAMGQTGILQILFTDINDKLVAGYGITKSDMSGNSAKCSFWVGGNTPKEYTSFGFETNNGEKNQKYPNNMFNSSTGDADFLKEGANFGFYWYGSRKTTYVPELENVEIAKVYLYIGQFKNSNKFINNLSIRGLNLMKNNVSVWSDIPNRYAAGSVVEIDMENDKIFTNGVATNKDFVKGGNFFSLPPGESTLLISQSTFNHTPPQVELTWKENYL